VAQLMSNNIFHKCAHVVLVVLEKSTTFIILLHNEQSPKVKWGHVTWICKDSQFALSSYTSKMICAVLDV